MNVILDAGFIATVSIAATLFIAGVIIIIIAWSQMAKEGYSLDDEMNFEID